MKKIVMATFGTFGEVQPYLSLALELKQRGYRVVFCTSEFYRPYITGHQIEFHALRPGHGDNQVLLQCMTHPTKGIEFTLREWLGSAIRESYQDLIVAAADADLLINNTTSLAGPLVAEMFEIPLVSCALAPAGVQSGYEPLVMTIAPWLRFRSWMPVSIYRAMLPVVDQLAANWLKPVIELRRELGLATHRSPLPRIRRDAWATHNLLLYSSMLGGPRSDWPAATTQTGFPRLPQTVDPVVRPQAERFFAEGPPPVAFTLGTAAVQSAGSFYETSATVLRQTNRRGLLLTGKGINNLPPNCLTDNIAAFDYLPLEYVFERSKVAVHQGGIGTCAQALHAGIPMIVVPHSANQPDNANRLRRLGVANVIPARQFTARRLQRALDEIDGDPGMNQRALELKARLSRENGVATACNCIEHVLLTVGNAAAFA